MPNFNNQHENILRAIEFATLKHCMHSISPEKAFRKHTGEPYIVHPIRVAKLVAHLGEPFMSVAILHDVREDTHTTFEELEKAFGSVIAQCVEELTDVPHSMGNRKTRKDLNNKKLQSPVAKTVKCADIIDNYPSIKQYDPKFAAVFASEKNEMLPYLDGADVKLLEQMKDIVK